METTFSPLTTALPITAAVSRRPGISRLTVGSPRSGLLLLSYVFLVARALTKQSAAEALQTRVWVGRRN